MNPSKGEQGGYHSNKEVSDGKYMSAVKRGHGSKGPRKEKVESCAGKRCKFKKHPEEKRPDTKENSAPPARRPCINMAEAKKKHCQLYVTLDGLIIEDLFKRIRRMAHAYRDRKTVEKAKDMDQLLSDLGDNNVIGVGKYDNLIEIIKGSWGGLGIDEIKQTAKDIEDIQNRIPKHEPSEMYILDAHTSNLDSVSPHPAKKKRPVPESSGDSGSDAEFESVTSSVSESESEDEVASRKCKRKENKSRNRSRKRN